MNSSGSLGLVNGELIHRYFGENAFKELSTKKSVNDVIVMTYVDLKSAKSNLEYILNLFNDKTDDLTILLGLSWFKVKDEITNIYKLSPESVNKYDSLIKFVSTISANEKFSFRNLNIHFNSRCHIKALYADESTYIGSQNIASTSECFSKNKHFYNLFNNHEVLVRLDDPSGEKARALLNEILKDDIHSNTVISNGIFIGAPTLLALEQDRSIENIVAVSSLVKTVKDGIQEIRYAVKYNQFIEIKMSDLDREDGDSLVPLFGHIINSGNYEGALPHLRELLKSFIGKNDLDLPSEESWMDFRDDIGDMYNLLKPILDEVCPELSSDLEYEFGELIDCFDDYKHPSISDVKVLGSYYDEICKIIEDEDVYSIQAFEESFGQSMKDAAVGIRGEVSSKYVDGDGEPLFDEIPLDELPSTSISKVHNEKSIKVGVEILNLLIVPIEEEFTDWFEGLSSTLNAFSNQLESIEVSDHFRPLFTA